jgi:hypothetical protein
MIYNALHSVVSQLNTYLNNRFSNVEDKAILGPILSEEGSIPEGNRNKVIMTLVNMEQETARPYAQVYKRDDSDMLRRLSDPLNFNLDILITALFTNYDEALKFLSETVYFFQSHNFFNHNNTPRLSPNIDQLTFEVIKLTYSETHNLWTALGAKYMPSVLFKMRMLSFQDSEGTITHEILHPEPVVNP